MPTPSLLDTRTAADHLADAEHYERWADRVEDNAGLSATLRKLAADARTRAQEAHFAPVRSSRGWTQALEGAPG